MASKKQTPTTAIKLQPVDEKKQPRASCECGCGCS